MTGALSRATGHTTLGEENNEWDAHLLEFDTGERRQGATMIKR